jgi:hypothetical protein
MPRHKRGRRRFIDDDNYSQRQKFQNSGSARSNAQSRRYEDQHGFRGRRRSNFKEDGRRYSGDSSSSEQQSSSTANSSCGNELGILSVLKIDTGL